MRMSVTDRVSKHNIEPARPRPIFWSQTVGLVLRPTVSDHITADRPLLSHLATDRGSEERRGTLISGLWIPVIRPMPLGRWSVSSRQT